MENFREIWVLERDKELMNRTWWWWWWLFIFKDRSGTEKQLMCLLGTRNCKKIWVDDYLWERKIHPVDDEKGTTTGGVAAAWYFDGRKMHDPLYIDSGKMFMGGDDENGVASLEGSHGMYSMKGAQGGSKFEVDAGGLFRSDSHTKDGKISLSTKPCGGQSSIVPTGKNYVGKMSYRMLKIRRVDASGTISLGGQEELVEGTAYFQKVRINSPTSPWFWTFLHAESGHYIDYFVPHFGLPMLRRCRKHGSILDRGWKKLSRGLHVADPNGSEVFRIKRFKVAHGYVNDLPVFRITGTEGEKSIDMELTAYSRACWRIEQPWLGFLSTILHYNEYPAHVTRFEARDGNSKLTLDDLGHTVGNFEHAWGIV